ncbi:hypothetical protein [Bradyrhizobium liaoningense]|uniref:hypothetical protein n=1 Tax=Bradyrhizobium liaoningense TaxID=43992 RepID=UPI003D9B4F1B
MDLAVSTVWNLARPDRDFGKTSGAFPRHLEPLLRSGSFFWDKSIWVIEVPQPKTRRLGLDESIASWPPDGSRGGLFLQRANVRAGVYDTRRIKGGLDTAHRSDAADIAVPLQKVLLGTTDAVLSTEMWCRRQLRLQCLVNGASLNKSSLPGL